MLGVVEPRVGQRTEGPAGPLACGVDLLPPRVLVLASLDDLGHPRVRPPLVEEVRLVPSASRVRLAVLTDGQPRRSKAPLHLPAVERRAPLRDVEELVVAAPSPGPFDDQRPGAQGGHDGIVDGGSTTGVPLFAPFALIGREYQREYQTSRNQHESCGLARSRTRIDVGLGPPTSGYGTERQRFDSSRARWRNPC